LQGEQQQRHDDHITTLENLEQHMDDFGDGPLANLSNLAIEEDDNENSDDESPSHLVTTGGTATATFTSRKAQKAAQKKSKKAKRREKEENAEREVRVEAEKTRQRDRADRLGIVVDDTSAITTNASSLTHPSSSIDGTAIERGDPVASTTSASSLKPCNTCGGAFTPGEYRLHFRSDWHRYNVKLKLNGVTAVSEREFLLCDSDIFFE
jgi:U3 small nucleolar RNA-associated protein 14